MNTPNSNKVVSIAVTMPSCLNDEQVARLMVGFDEYREVRLFCDEIWQKWNMDREGDKIILYGPDLPKDDSEPAFHTPEQRMFWHWKNVLIDVLNRDCGEMINITYNATGDSK